MIEKLPCECLLEIFNKFRDNSLFSCLLVNRRWCRIIVPILWRNIDKHLGDRRAIRICLLSLNAEEQTLLIPFNIALPNCPKPLFEYTSYTTSISDHLNIGIVDWFNYYDDSPVEYIGNGLHNALKCSLISMFL
ncbi:hypothetical protein F8M41_024396 [Gigaspora margarita]|uniref:F-box domain-containing protein n=1 Tax=Gigaspora margarita TaxID=4874 RepID=A0A8H4AAW8_GIGMA|nr:hypothetical protein F8M41_024396 [Gigaspora margarita]